MLTIVKNDLFNIAKRLKQVNSKYHLFFNAKTCRYEVHNSEKPRGILSQCFVVDTLDARVIEHAHRTKIENYDYLAHQMDLQNEYLENSAMRELKNNQARLADMMSYASGQIHEVVFHKSSKWF